MATLVRLELLDTDEDLFELPDFPTPELDVLDVEEEDDWGSLDISEIESENAESLSGESVRRFELLVCRWLTTPL